MNIKGYRITDNIKDKIILLCFRIFSSVPVSNRIRNKNLKNNISAWNSYILQYPDDLYIEHQRSLRGMMFGLRYTADYNSCEVIALYNALIALNNEIDISFPELLLSFERKGITMGGAFGASPYALKRYLGNSGYIVDCYNYKQRYIIASDEYDAFIMMSYNNSGSIKDMIHTMCITKEDNSFKLHNDYEGSRQYKTLIDAVEGYNKGKSRMIIILAIKKDKNDFFINNRRKNEK